ncbi:MAG: dihydrodipicolinate synthase family protein [Chloroflexota bacterium]
MRATVAGGVICPIITPLDAEERLDEAALRKLIDRLLPEVDGFVVLGSSGEYALLRPAVAQRAVELTIEIAAKGSGRRVPVLVGVGDTGTARMLDNLAAPLVREASYAIVCSSFYYPVTDQRALRDHFLAAADASPVPIFLYNIPQNTASNLTPESVGMLAEHPNVVGLKDSWGDMLQFQGFLAARPEGFAVVQGQEQLAAASMWLGADGLISGAANFAPALLRAVVAAVHSGDRAESLRLQRQVTELARLFDEGYWLSALKAAMAEVGIGNGRAAKPLPQLDAIQRARIRQCMEKAGLELEPAAG